MKFDELDERMRGFETRHDSYVLEGIPFVARLDGRGFTRLTKQAYDFERPFDLRFRDAMLATAEHAMQVGLRALYGYTQSDEISLLFGPDEAGFGRKMRKLNSVLAGEASAKFSLELARLAREHAIRAPETTSESAAVACFDCRISQLPTRALVVDYFRWRQEDAHRNALNAHCYWQLRGDGASAKEATKKLSGLSVAEKNELLFAHGINYNDLPAWQKRGCGLRWAFVDHEGEDPRTGERVVVERRRLTRDLDLPKGDAYDDYLRGCLAD